MPNKEITEEQQQALARVIDMADPNTFGICNDIEILKPLASDFAGKPVCSDQAPFDWKM